MPAWAGQPSRAAVACAGLLAWSYTSPDVHYAIELLFITDLHCRQRYRRGTRIAQQHCRSAA